jgi:hypothetical protein
MYNGFGLAFRAGSKPLTQGIIAYFYSALSSKPHSPESKPQVALQIIPISQEEVVPFCKEHRTNSFCPTKNLCTMSKLRKKSFTIVEQACHEIRGFRKLVAISNHRLLNISDEGVTFRWRDYRDNTESHRYVFCLKAPSGLGLPCQ